MKFKDTLKQILNSRKLKQAELCRMTGIQTSLMSEYLSGKKSPTIGNALLIADALNISLDTLVGKDEYSYTEDVSKSKTEPNDQLINELESVYKTLNEANRKYLYGYAYRLLEEQNNNKE